MTTEEKMAVAASKAAAKAAAKVEAEEARKAKTKATNEARRLKAQAKARKATQAKARGAQTSALTRLAPVAKEINHRLSKADKMEDDATDHRLAAALQLAVAKGQCKSAKIKFEAWCDENVMQSYSTVRRLATIGEAGKEDGLRLLDDARGKNAEANKKARAKAKTKAAGNGAANPAASAAQRERADTPFTAVARAMKAMNDDEAAKTISWAAESLGLQLVSADEATAARKAAEAIRYGPVDQIKALFAAATPRDKMKVVNFIVAEVGATITMDPIAPANGADDDDLLYIPDSLKRKAPAKKGSRRRKAAAI